MNGSYFYEEYRDVTTDPSWLDLPLREQERWERVGAAVAALYEDLADDDHKYDYDGEIEELEISATRPDDAL